MSVNIAQVPFKELRQACLALNNSDLLETKIKTKGVKKRELLDTFCDAIEELDNSGQVENIPEVAFDFYNALSEFEEEEEFEDEPVEEEDLEEVSDLEDELEEVAEKPKPKKKPKKKPKAKAKPKKKKKKVTQDEEVEGGEVEEEEAPKPTRVRVATVPMSVKIEDGKLTILFKEDGGATKRMKMPAKNHKNKIKMVLDKALEFAKENGATMGQLKAVRKTFNVNGYYLTK